MNEQWVLLWSKGQNCLHIEPVERMLSSNRNAYRDNRACDYITIHIGSRADVDDAADACRGTLDGRMSASQRRAEA